MVCIRASRDVINHGTLRNSQLRKIYRHKSGYDFTNKQLQPSELSAATSLFKYSDKGPSRLTTRHSPLSAAGRGRLPRSVAPLTGRGRLPRSPGRPGASPRSAAPLAGRGVSPVTPVSPAPPLPSRPARPAAQTAADRETSSMAASAPTR